jgi:uncharacterized membrane protein
MVTKAHVWTDQRTEQVIGQLLRLGVTLSAAVVVLGGMVYLVRHGMEPPTYGVFRGEPSDLRNVEGIVGQVQVGRGRGIIQLGLLLLIATPVARVAFSVVAFALERDRLYVAITLIVLAVLLFSLAGGHF